MKVVIIDGQGGKLGQKLAEAISGSKVECELCAVGTNTVATSAMLKGGAEYAATGENAVIVACRDADVIVGPIGMVCADSLMGEITPAMAVAIGQSRAVKLLLPVSHCNNQVVGVKNLSLSDMVEAAVEKLKDCSGCGK
ncbi:MAG: DUF3842 family protein [Lachnospiraceae bacterium]|nr:DUF3842 family protein [Lachnospiraceae bacterium]